MVKYSYWVYIKDAYMCDTCMIYIDRLYVRYLYGMHRSVSIFIWLIWNCGYNKYVLVVEKSLKMFLFFYYISIISLTFDENGGEK
jgi:hypothetical protein